MNAIRFSPRSAPRRPRSPGAAPSRWVACGLALSLLLWLSVFGRGQTSPGTTDLPAPAPAPAATDNADAPPGTPDVPGTPPATPAPTPAASSLLLIPGATPAPPPTPDPNALPAAPNAPRAGGAPSSLAPPPAGAGGPLPTDSPAAPSDSAATTLAKPNDVRRFRYNFRLTLGAVYNDNVLLSTSGQQSDLYFTISPALILGYGDIQGGSASNYVSFTYNPEALLYVEHPNEDAVQHFIRLNGVYHLGQFTLTGSEDISILDNTDFSQAGATTATGPGGTGATQPVNNVNLDAAQRTRVNLFSTSLGASYAYSDKTSFDFSLQSSVADYQKLISSETYAASVFANYAVTGKITVGLGVTGGYLVQDDGTVTDSTGKTRTISNPNQSYEQGNLRLTYLFSDKFNFLGQVGLEIRQQDNAGGSEVNPVFSLSANYLPFDSTAVTLSASRQVNNSAVNAGQDFTTTSITVSLSQRFLQRIFARLSVGYINSVYTSQTATINSDREDNYFFVQPGLDYNLRDNLSVGAFYLHRESHSSQTRGSFDNNQIGVHVSYSF